MCVCARARARMCVFVRACVCVCVSPVTGLEWTRGFQEVKLRSPDYMTTAQDGDGKFVSPTNWPPLPPGNAPGTHFC